MNALVADKEARVRSAVRLLLEQMPGVKTVDEACDRQSLIDGLGRRHTDLLLLDWELANSKTAELLPRLRLLAPGIKVVALSVSDEDRECALASGANAFVSKTSPPEELIAILTGLRWLVDG